MRDPVQETTHKFGRLLAAVGELGEDLHGQGVVDLEQIRLTIRARQDEAKRQIANGKSIRQTAKELGVEKSTVQRDLGLKKQAELKAPKAELKAPLRDSSPERWRLSVKGFAYDAARLRKYWDKEFPNWQTYEVSDEEIFDLVKQAISEWSEIKTVMERKLR